MIDKLKACSEEELLSELKKIEAWTYGKCELYHWVDVLDLCDTILEKACKKEHEHSWVLACDLQQHKQVILFKTYECIASSYKFCTVEGTSVMDSALYDLAHRAFFLSTPIQLHGTPYNSVVIELLKHCSWSLKSSVYVLQAKQLHQQACI